MVLALKEGKMASVIENKGNYDEAMSKDNKLDRTEAQPLTHSLLLCSGTKGHPVFLPLPPSQKERERQERNNKGLWSQHCTVCSCTHLFPKSKVDFVSASLKEAGEAQMTMVVRALPPRLSCRMRVSLESR